MLLPFFTILSLSLQETVSTEISCNREYCCANDTLVTNGSNSNILCNGLASCSNSILINNIGTITDDLATTCGGKQSCANSQIIKGSSQYPIEMAGYRSGAFVDSIYVPSRWFGGYAEGSLFGVSNMTVAEGSCAGVFSCAQIERMVIHNELLAYGMYSMVGTNLIVEYINETRIVNNDNSVELADNTLDIHLLGYYSGLNTTVTCMNGTNCRLFCGLNYGCYNTRFICNTTDGYTCRAYTLENDIKTEISTLASGTEEIFTIKPNTDVFEIAKQYSHNLTQYDEFINISLNTDIDNGMEIIDFEYLKSINSIDYETIDFDIDSAQVFNDYDGANGRRSINLLQTWNEINNSDVWCNSANSCSSSVIANMTDISNVYCNGGYSCQESDISSINGSSSSRAGSIYCRGSGACRRTGIRSFKKAVISGRRGAYEANITDGTYLGCYGSGACSKATISNVHMIVVTAKEGLADSVVKSGGSGNNMVIYMIATAAAKDVTIYCENGDECMIICLNQECGLLFGDSNTNDYNYNNGSVICNGCNSIEVVYLNQNLTTFPS